MPELPEIETIKNDLGKKIINKKIKDVEVGLNKIIRSNLGEFKSVLIGNKFIAIDRRGKLLIFKLASRDKTLLIHLKMTGQLIYCQKGKMIVGGHSLPKIESDLPNKYSHVIFYFSDGARLFFNDMRQFGYLKLVDRQELKKIIGTFGIEPLEKEFKLKNIKEILTGRKINIKAVLLNQQLIAGIGNIYADEILFEAGIRPNRLSGSLKDKEIKKVYQAIRVVLKKAVKYRGTTFNNYVDANGHKGNFIKFLKVYQREEEKCLRCKQGTIVKAKIAGRGTRFCPQCQK
jgi:formamidopyrimidine-DNA glycosylase